MGLTVSLTEESSIRVTEEEIEARPPDGVAFVAEGTVALTGALLGQFEGQSLKPVRVDLAVDGETVSIDLEEDASLRLDAVDVGIETPDTGDLPPEMDAVTPPLGNESESMDARPGAIAFTVEGVIIDVSAVVLERLASEPARLEAITFAVEDPVRSDGGADDVVFEFAILGYGIAVHRDGTIDIGTRGTLANVGRP